MTDYHAFFEPEYYYHIYNRGNNKEDIFKKGENYWFFLEKWKQYIHPFVDTLAYCQMPNHFHFAIRVKNEKEISDIISTSLTKSSRLGKTLDINSILENQFKLFFMSYAKSFNKQQNRTGSLFQKRFKRVLVQDNAKILELIQYIHHNPIHHHFKENYESWNYSSYNSLLNNKPTALAKQLVFELFTNKKHFIDFHNDMKGIEGNIFIDNQNTTS